MWLIALGILGLIVGLYLSAIIYIAITFKDFGKDPYGN